MSEQGYPRLTQGEVAGACTIQLADNVRHNVSGPLNRQVCLPALRAHASTSCQAHARLIRVAGLLKLHGRYARGMHNTTYLFCEQLQCSVALCAQDATVLYNLRPRQLVTLKPTRRFSLACFASSCSALLHFAMSGDGASVGARGSPPADANNSRTMPVMRPGHRVTYLCAHMHTHTHTHTHT